MTSTQQLFIHSEVLPLQKGGRKKAMLKGGEQKCFWVVLTRVLEVLALLKRSGAKGVNHLKRGGARKVLLYLKGAAKSFTLS